MPKPLSYNYYRLTTLLFFLFASISTFAQLNPALDVQHYRFSLALNDVNNVIYGDAIAAIKFKKDVEEVSLGLVAKNSNGMGMVVTQVTKSGIPLNFIQDSNHLIIRDTVKMGTVNMYEIQYHGEPADGLIISNNKFGDRTFFGDNWAERAHNWLPCNDHVADKASVEFLVTAPDHYQVVANGLKIEETNLPNHQKLTYWKEDVALAPKIMTIGVADFAVNYIGNVDCIPVDSWLFPQDKDTGFTRYVMAKNILPWLIKQVGPYAYKKLSNVEAKTAFGGMENANAIFYYEPSVHLPGLEDLMTHEIAHQWFGNSASEKDWSHVWLSEGFATYMTHLYLESKYGPDSLNRRMRRDRDTVISFLKKRMTPIVDTTPTHNLSDLLNRNSYEKGGWVLHMLRRKIGDRLFWEGIQSYYKSYAGSNANTEDFEKSIETVSGQDLKPFFKQWCYTVGQPQLNMQWTYNPSKKSVKIKVEQLQNSLFNFPLEIGLSIKNKSLVKRMIIKSKLTVREFPVSSKPDKIEMDPKVNLLFEEIR